MYALELQLGTETGAEEVWRSIGYDPAHIKRRLMPDGYIRVWVERGGRAYLEHRVVATYTLGRGLRRGEVVHHRNGKKADNSPENLQVCASASEHARIHVGWGASPEYLLLVKHEMQRALIRPRGSVSCIERIHELIGASA